MIWLAFGGWIAVAVLAGLVFVWRARFELVARAEHEIRGPLAALALAVDQVRRGRAGPELAGALDAQLERCRAGLSDLSQARRGRRATARPTAVRFDRFAHDAVAGWSQLASRAGRTLRLDWNTGPATVTTDRGRLSQVLGNLLSNSLEHGIGDVLVRGRRVDDAIRIEVAPADRADVPVASTIDLPSPNRTPGRRGRDRGRGLAIASRAAGESGGTLEVGRTADGVTAALELPLDVP